MVVKAFRRALVGLLILFSICWVGTQIPLGQQYLKTFVESWIEESAGVKVKIGKIDLFPFFVRLSNVRIEDPRDKSLLFSCERISASALLFDVPLKRLTLFSLRMNDGYLDVDKIETLHGGVGGTSFPYSLSVFSYKLSSCHIISHRLPLHQSSIDCTIKGKIKLSKDGSVGTATMSFTRVDSRVWPKRFDVQVSRKQNSFQGKGSLYLSTDGPLFFGNDRVDISCEGELRQDCVQKLSGTWSALLPTTTQASWDEFLVNRGVHAEGTFSYIPRVSLEATCNTFHGLFSLNRLIKVPADIEGIAVPSQVSQPLQTVFAKGSMRISCVSTADESIRLKVSLPYFSLNKLKGNLQGSVDLSVDKQALLSSYVFDGQLTSDEKVLPIKCTGAARLEGKNWTSTLDVLASPFYWTSRLSDASMWTSFRCQDLSFFQPLLEKPLSGSIELSAQTNLQSQTPPSSISCRFSDLSLLSLRCGQGDFLISQEGQDLNHLVISTDLAGLKVGSMDVDKFHANGTVDLEAKRIRCTDLRLIGRKNKLLVDVFGSGDLKAEEQNRAWILFHHIEGFIGGEKVKIEKPLQVEYANGLLSLPSVTLRIAEQGRISGAWRQLSKNEGSGDLSFYHLPFSLLAQIAEVKNATGTIDGECHYAATPTTVTATSKFHSELQLDTHGVSIGGSITIEDSTLSFEACAAGRGIEEPLVLSLSCPVTRIPQTPCISIGTSEIQGRARGQVRLSQVLTYFVPTEIDVDAIIDADIRVGGTVARPHMQGSVHLKDGTFGMIPTGLVLSDIQMEGRLDNGTVYVDLITATDGKEGTVKGSGEIRGLTDEKFYWLAKLSCQDVEAINLDYAKTTADGDIKLEGTASSLSIAGSATTKAATLDLAAHFLPNVPEIPITFCDEEKKPPESIFLVLFDLAVDAHNGVEIQGRGLSSLWEGTIHLGETSENLRVDGTLRCVHGSLNLANKEIKISEGTISSMGNVFTDSRLNISANVVLPTITAQAILKGSIENPKLSLQSIPTKPDNEILSLIIFNKEFSDISPLESFQLANAATLFQHSSGPFSLIDKFKTTFGIDTIDVGPSATPLPSKTKSEPIGDSDDPNNPGPEPVNDVSLKVGKYISDGVAVNVSRDVSADANRVGISAQIVGNVTAEAEVGDDNAGIVSLKWKKNY
jgi:hypothetical protein